MSGAEAGAKQRIISRKSAVELLFALAEYGLVAYGLYKLTEKLSRISGNALWLPEPWRQLLVTLMPGLGVMLYLFVKVFVGACKSGVKKVSPDAGEQGSWPRMAMDGTTLGLAICLTLWAVFNYFEYSALGQRCDKQVQLSPAQWSSILVEAEQAPPFCDRTRGTFLVPPEEMFDSDWRATAVRYGKEARGLNPGDTGTAGVDYFGAGIERIFTEQPELYVAWAQGSGSGALADIKVRFAEMHLFIVTLVAIAAALSSSPVGILVEKLVKLLRGEAKAS